MSGRKLIVTAAVVGVALAFPGLSAAQLPPRQDSVTLTSGPAQAGDFTLFGVDATSGPSGENPTGHVTFRVRNLFAPIDGPVTCLAVRGNTATLNIQDQAFNNVTVQATDDQPDTFDALPTSRAPANCSPLPRSSLFSPLSSGDITVVDAPPFPTAKNQCKNGGWKRFGFKNQGQCIRFVKQGPKKLGAGLSE